MAMLVMVIIDTNKTRDTLFSWISLGSLGSHYRSKNSDYPHDQISGGGAQ